MEHLTRPIGVSSRVWQAMVDDHKAVEGRRVMIGYGQLSNNEGPDQRHYKDMFEMLFAKWATPAEKAAYEFEKAKKRVAEILKCYRDQS